MLEPGKSELKTFIVDLTTFSKAEDEIITKLDEQVKNAVDWIRENRGSMTSCETMLSAMNKLTLLQFDLLGELRAEVKELKGLLYKGNGFNATE